MATQSKTEPLPTTIFCPEGGYLYNGTPLEMVKQMAAEMGEGITAPQAIDTLLLALAYFKHIYIGVPEDLPVDDQAELFIGALLDQGVSRPLVAAA